MAQAMPPAACETPDSALLKSRGAYSGHAELPEGDKIALYNAQVRRFNDCTRNLVDGNNAQIDRVRNDGNASIRRITDGANKQIDVIQAKMKWAASGIAPAAGAMDIIAGVSFPNPDCRKPDPSLLTAAAKKSGGRPDSGIARSEEYDRQQQAYQACVPDYIVRASAEAKRIETVANAQIRQVADDANSRIANLRSIVRSGIETANAAALAKSQMVEGTPLARNDPILAARAAENPLEDAKADRRLWTVIQDTPTGNGNRRAITCRAPQPITGSHLLGPEICRRNGVWAALRKAGQDIGPDGKTIVSLDETRRTNPTACTRVQVPLGPGGDGGSFVNTFCN